MMKKIKWSIYISVFCCVALLSSPVAADAGENHVRELASGQFDVSTFYTADDVEYKTTFGGVDDKFVNDRRILGLSLTGGITDKLNMFGTFGYLTDSRLQNEGKTRGGNHDGGYHVAAGLTYKAFQSGQLSGNVYGKFKYNFGEKYISTDIVTLDLNRNRVPNARAEYEVSGYELTLGGVLNYQLMSKFDIYAGLEYVPLESLTADHTLSVPGFNPLELDSDLERSDKLGFAAGVQYLFTPNWTIGTTLKFGSTNGYTINIGRKF